MIKKQAIILKNNLFLHMHIYALWNQIEQHKRSHRVCNIYISEELPNESISSTQTILIISKMNLLEFTYPLTIQQSCGNSKFLQRQN